MFIPIFHVAPHSQPAYTSLEFPYLHMDVHKALPHSVIYRSLLDHYTHVQVVSRHGGESGDLEEVLSVVGVTAQAIASDSGHSCLSSVSYILIDVETKEYSVLAEYGR